MPWPRPAPASVRSRPAPARPRSRLALAAGALVALAATAGLSALGESSYLVRDPAYGDLELRLSAVERTDPAPAVFLGTSRVNSGFDAGRGGAFNFGVPGTGPVTHNIYLRRLIGAGHRPGLLLVEVLPALVADLGGEPLEARMTSGSRYTRDEVDRLAGYGVPRDRLDSQWRETRTVPWLGLRFQLLGRVAPWALPAHLRHDEGRSGDARGWRRIPEEVLTPALVAAGRARARNDYAEVLRTLTPGGPAERALRDTVRLARGHGLRVRLVVMPEAAWFRDLMPAEVGARFDRWLARLASEEGCPVTDARRWVPDAGFADGHHLLPGGAAAFTDRLAAEVLAPEVTP
ncbi:hypothetical protein : Uncharacterized protein OS=Singulisphaera acidiphila (strain ATCC BAA-1392 / DSM 18658 / VKM B-2454 / MOB10) GN=Sinac_5817 PE=4 SV=1 [Gemmataceae bacterium]|nr:hypothetical protein : Uncharacterized protein OS=Singulisphaera acidiphila (strain ATCC BAA-1392 / DSM 18658 / VKM B-2454 / MOB10) GN=Sinac_5817 PE=4 SV=1 [Gemmataceae bacterium]VTU00392.1 hypothetical protein : Uncharacterized protein OS=Singulisphaera acidiphila (strain ATCC BAA-1392 / DSM 18658 / VKM B-2454 / MOB10) GN=Sinac_5817 PE=4 SV=1 [Gemmataceae bacterium]